ncbi:hypothetical protein [Streptomyces sp. MBT60]|uniref:DUF7691 family protein n=1 Tax=Streptomyces sp. MBT60 TaxID=2800409 RepID=UPI00190DF3D4|nr:hypothetical protein [Streptomyces sp. MBT60]MBK3544949.1 hypothetical protein [Streptomyces sp. MBT60]
MSKIVNYNMASRTRVAQFVTGRDLTADDKETLEQVREMAHMRQADLERQEVDWGLTVPDALEHLLSGRADSPAEWAGNAYYTALQHVIDYSGSDISTLASYSSPITLYSVLDKELGAAGVEPGLLPTQYIFSGPPSEIPFHIPRPPEGSPEIGVWPMQKAGPAIQAYREALDRIDPDLRYELSELIEALDGWYSGWHRNRDMPWWREDTSIFFSVAG